MDQREKELAQKAKLIEVMYTLHPELQGRGDNPWDYDLENLMNGMILGIASHPKCDDLIPFVQTAMDVLGKGGSVEGSIKFWRSPNVLSPVLYSKDEKLEQVAERVIRHAEEWTE